jgi:hypothetical protein
MRGDFEGDMRGRKRSLPFSELDYLLIKFLNGLHLSINGKSRWAFWKAAFLMLPLLRMVKQIEDGAG